MRAFLFPHTRWLRALSRAATAGVAAACLLVTSTARAELPGDCMELGVAITEHSCFHSEFGPFETVQASAGTTASKDTPNIDLVHTEYRIGLAGEYSVVTYTPKRSGAWAVLLSKDVPLQVLGGEGEALSPIFDESGTTGCDALPLLHVYELWGGGKQPQDPKPTTYRFVFGPAAERTIVAVVEYIDDFLTQNGRDDDGDGFGGKEEVIETPCEPPAGFAPNTRDCNDDDPLINPGAEEACDGIDQNCNGSADDVGLTCRVGAGACRAEGKTSCTAGSGPMCTVTPLEPSVEMCNGLDDDCNGKIDDADDLCTDPARPTCVRSGMAAACGCKLDLDCGGQKSGRICNVQKGICEDGCSPLPGGNNDCSADEVCNPNTARCESVPSAGGAAGAEGVAGDASVSGSGGASGSSPSSGGTAPSEGGEPSASGSGGGNKADDGCGCRAAGRQRSQGTALSAFGLALFLSHLRRRHRARTSLAAALAATSLVACGGRTQNFLEASGGHDGGPTLGGSATGGASKGGSGASTAGEGSAGGAVQQPPECVPELGEQLIEHACSHTSNGPFIAVLAGGSGSPPDVSDLHRTYELEVAGTDARVRYRAQREGSHAFMTNLPAAFELQREGRPLSALPTFAVAGCDSIVNATVYDLQREAEYDLVVLQSPPSLNLFVEHLGAFGPEAWLEACDAPAR